MGLEPGRGNRRDDAKTRTPALRPTTAINGCGVGGLKSGGHGTRTRNRFPGTTFPVWPLAIRLPSKRTCIISSTAIGRDGRSICEKFDVREYAVALKSSAPLT